MMQKNSLVNTLRVRFRLKTFLYKDYKHGLFWQSWFLHRQKVLSLFPMILLLICLFFLFSLFNKKKSLTSNIFVFLVSLPLSSSSLTPPSNVNSPPCAPQPSEQRSRYQEFRQHFRLHFQCLSVLSPYLSVHLSSLTFTLSQLLSFSQSPDI